MKKLITLFCFSFLGLNFLTAQTFTLGIVGNSTCGCSSSCNPLSCSPTASGNCPTETINSAPVLVPANSNVRVQIVSIGSATCIANGAGLDVSDLLLVNGVAVFSGSNAAVNFDQCYSSGTSATSITISLTANRRDEQVSVTLTTTAGAGTGCTVLPPVLRVSLLSFAAQRLGNNAILLNWATASETNNQYMAVERSADGTAFAEIGRVKGNGTTTIEQNYQLTDNYPLQAGNYYRLRIVDVNGGLTYSKVLYVKGNSAKQQISIYPNPVADVMEVTSVNTINEINVYDAKGSRIVTRKVQNTNTQQINLKAFPPGVYLVKVKTNGEIFSQKIIKK